MKKCSIIIKPILFVLIFLLLIQVFGRLFMPKDNTSKSGMRQVEAHGFLGEKENTIDVLFMGDSESYTSFSPMQMYDEYGFTGYVLGVSAQRIYNQYYYLKKALEYQKPKVVVIETNTLFRKYKISDALGGEITNSVPFIEYHNRWKKMNIRDFTLKPKYTYTNITKGFKIKKNIESVKNEDYMKKTNKVTEVPYLNAYYVKKIKSLCDEHNIKLLLVSSKSLRNWNYGRHLGMENFTSNNDISYLDLNLIKEIDIDWENDTPDEGDHLNINGAQKVSRYIGKYLYENYGLISHKNDSAYKKWNDDLKEYHRLLDES